MTKNQFKLGKTVAALAATVLFYVPFAGAKQELVTDYIYGPDSDEPVYTSKPNEGITFTRESRNRILVKGATKTGAWSNYSFKVPKNGQVLYALHRPLQDLSSGMAASFKRTCKGAPEVRRYGYVGFNDDAGDVQSFVASTPESLASAVKQNGWDQEMLSDGSEPLFWQTCSSDWEFTARYQPNGAPGEEQVVVFTNSTTVADCTFSYPGYKFGGWTYGSSTVQPGDEIELDGDDRDPVFKAKWTGVPYTVKFDANADGQESGSMQPMSCTYGKQASLTPNSFTRRGYRFIGWSRLPGGEVDFDDNDKVLNLTTDEDDTVWLYAKWELYTGKVELKAAPGSVSPTSIEVTWGKLWSANGKLPKAVREPTVDDGFDISYTFCGWYYRNASGSEVTVDDNSYYDDFNGGHYVTELLAKWSEQKVGRFFWLSFNPGDDLPVPASLKFQRGATYSGLPRVDRVGYDMSAWQYRGITVKDGEEVLLTADETVVAVWTPRQYEVKLDFAGGSNGTEGVTMTYTQTPPHIKPPVRAGYACEGYFTDGGEQIYGSNGYAVVGQWLYDDIDVLYARWQKLPELKKVTFDFGEGFEPLVTNILEGSELGFLPPAPPREGYAVKWWYDAASNTVCRVRERTVVRDNMTVKARWSLVRFNELLGVDDLAFDTTASAGIGPWCEETESELTYDGRPTLRSGEIDGEGSLDSFLLIYVPCVGDLSFNWAMDVDEESGEVRVKVDTPYSIAHVPSGHRSDWPNQTLSMRCGNACEVAFEPWVEASSLALNRAWISNLRWEPDAEPVTVTVVGAVVTNVYDGAEHVASGKTVTASSPLYLEDDFSFTGCELAVGTDAGEYPFGMTAADFKNLNPEFKPTFEVTDGRLVILKAKLKPTTDIFDVSAEYDGGPHALSRTQIADAYGVEETRVSFGGSSEGPWNDEPQAVTNVGEYVQYFKVDGDANHEDDTRSAKVLVRAPAPVTVIVRGHSASVAYDGEDHTVEGYDVKSISNPHYTANDFVCDGCTAVTGCAVGVYRFGLSWADFRNLNDNFPEVAFMVEADGELEIRRAAIDPSTVPDFDVEVEYTGRAVTVDAAAISNFFAETYAGTVAYAASAAGPWTAEPPAFTTVGEHKVRCRVESANYERFEKVLTVKVTPGPFEIIQTADPVTIPYKTYAEETVGAYFAVKSSWPLKSVTASGLPSGLALKKNAAGEYYLKGQVKKSGIFDVKFVAKNSYPQTAERTIRFYIPDDSSAKTQVDVFAGEGGKASGSGYYAVGKKVTLKATAAKDYVFCGWFFDAGYTQPLAGDFLAASLSYPVADVEPVKVYAKFLPKSEATELEIDFADAVLLTAGVKTNLEVRVRTDTAFSLSVKKSLPSGLKLAKDKVTGRWSIAGTPSKPGTWTSRLLAKNKTNTKGVTKDVSFVVDQGRGPGVDGLDIHPSLVSAGGAEIKPGDALSFCAGVQQTIELGLSGLDGVATTLTAKGLPTGLKLVKTLTNKVTKAYSYVITGVPTKAQAAKTVTLTASNKYKWTGSVAFSVEVYALPLVPYGTTCRGLAEDADGHAGAFTLTVAKTGKVSGSYYRMGSKVSFSAPSLAEMGTDGESVEFWLNAASKIGKVKYVDTLKASGFREVARPDGLTYPQWQTELVASGGVLNRIEAVSDCLKQLYGTLPKAMATTYDLEDESLVDGEYLKLKVATSGKVTVAGKLMDGTGKLVSVSGTAYLVPTSAGKVGCWITIYKKLSKLDPIEFVRFWELAL